MIKGYPVIYLSCYARYARPGLPFQRFQMCAVVLTEVMLASLKNTMQL